MSQQNWIGQTIGGRYEILEPLGQGGMSTVYKANDPNLRRVVAVKLIHPHLSSNPEFVRRFEEEAAAVASLRHPNIIQVFDFNHDGDTFYIVFEFIPGESLQDHLKRLNEANRLMAYSQTVEIAASVSDALEYAHSRGMIHRDIKPANVMMNVHGQAILMDFGVVKIVGGDTHTATGAVVGTARYMSPEQIRGEKIDSRSDIYSLGVMLFEMVSSQPPYQADSALTVMMMHVNDPVPDLRGIRQDVPQDLVSVINKAMAKGRNERYQTGTELATALRAASLQDTVDKSTVVVPPAAAVAASQMATTPDTPAVPAQQAASPDTLTPTVPGASTGGATLSPPAAAPTETPAKSDRNRIAIFGGIAAAALLIVCLAVAAIIVGPGLLSGDGNDETGGTETAVAAALQTLEVEATEAAGIVEPATATPTEELVVIKPSATVTGQPTDTPPAATPTIAATQTTVATLSATYTPRPTEPPPPTEATGPQIRINNITSDGANYIVDYTPIGYTPALPGVHIHFFWNTVPPQNAGVGPTQESWILYGGPNPFTGYKVSDRPAAATQMCSLVANPDHTVQLNTGNCANLP
jgi:hypothetical protein